MAKAIKYDIKTGEEVIYDVSDKIPTLEELKQRMLDELKELTETQILTYYPQVKQMSDLADKEYYETILKAQNIDEVAFRQAIIQSVENIFNNVSDLQTEVSSIKAQFTTIDSVVIEQLLKVAIRVSFVQKCKQVYYTYYNQIQTATTEAELPNLDTIQFPRFPL